jgi:glycosyltransferase involved in cell wall biosynthesis
LQIKKLKLAIYTMHPIQYHAPIFRELAKEVEWESTVLYADTLGLEEEYIPEFNTVIKWDVPLLDDYNYLFFKNYAIKRLDGFFSRINPGMFTHLLAKRYDAVLIHGYQTFSAWLVFFAAKLAGTKVIVRGEAIPKKGKRSWKSRFASRMTQFYLAFSDAVMYSCTGNKEYWKEMAVLEKKMFFFPCAVDNAFFRRERTHHLPRRNKMRENLGIYSDDFVVLFSARFTDRKRPLDLIEAVATINHEKIVLLFVGEGPKRDAMEKLVSQHGIRAVFTGFVNQGELARYYTLADIFVVISSYDASPKALNEAMNFSIPVISSDQVGTARDLVHEGKNGFVVNVGDQEAIAKGINLCNLNREKSCQMGKVSANIVASWSIENNVKGLHEAVRYVLRSKD